MGEKGEERREEHGRRGFPGYIDALINSREEEKEKEKL